MTRIETDDIFYLENWAKNSMLGVFTVVHEGNTVHLSFKE